MVMSFSSSVLWKMTLVVLVSRLWPDMVMPSYSRMVLAEPSAATR